VPSAAETDDETITIVLADDHELVRAGIRKILEDEAGFEVVAEAGDAEAAARYVLGHKPSVLILDLSMPGLPSLEALPKVFELTVSITAMNASARTSSVFVISVPKTNSPTPQFPNSRIPQFISVLL